jgi:hypothetical protein
MKIKSSPHNQFFSENQLFTREAGTHFHVPSPIPRAKSESQASQ